ncbi:hypothetical protein PVAP13_8KG059810 [Panicum virgatum]|uniref:Endonuclease/exonuclease/phosphatase domain-containing protein n=1 Tax=Panicum virgatum TaxID=38727 RepID=A0A8T0Q025_PANVG|nr:hypothetical protein PVAP13_8KG059810 [Panicum virgatum]
MGKGRVVTPKGVSYRDLGTMINEQGSGCHSLSAVLHLRLGVVKNEVRKLAGPTRIRIVSWNVGPLTGKLRELVDTAFRRRVNILCVQESKWKGQKAKDVEGTGFKFWYMGATSGMNGVGILINRSLKDGVVEVKRRDDRIILVRLVVGVLVVNSTKKQFCEDLDSIVNTVPISEKLLIGGDLNGHVGATNVVFEQVHGGFGYGSKSQEGGGCFELRVGLRFVDSEYPF